MASYGIAKILRQVYLWNHTLIYQPISSKQKLQVDMKYTDFVPIKNSEPLAW